jgi:hypothetical protein
MKKLFFAACLTLTLTLRAQDAPVLKVAASPAPQYRAGEFNIDAYGAVRTTDFKDHRLGVGLGVAYFLTVHSGLRLDTFTSYLGGATFVDTASASYVYRIPIGPSAPYATIGADYEGERRNWGGHLGIGIEHRFINHLGVFVEARMVKLWDNYTNPIGEGRAGVRLSF